MQCRRFDLLANSILVFLFINLLQTIPPVLDSRPQEADYLVYQNDLVNGFGAFEFWIWLLTEAFSGPGCLLQTVPFGILREFLTNATAPALPPADCNNRIREVAQPTNEFSQKESLRRCSCWAFAVNVHALDLHHPRNA